MISQELSLIVPFDKELRHDIRSKTEAYFSVNDIMPPVSYDALSGYADMLIKTHQW